MPDLGLTYGKTRVSAMTKSFGKKKYEDEPQASHDFEAEERSTIDPVMIGAGALLLIFLSLMGYQLLAKSDAQLSGMPLATETASQSLMVQSMDEMEQANPELSTYLNPTPSFSSEARKTRYVRTVNLIDKCGKDFLQISSDYRARNSVTYKNLKAESAASTVKHTSAQLNPDDMRLQITIQTDSNTSMGMLRNGQTLTRASEDKEFARQLTPQECQYLALRITQGHQNI